MRRLMLILAVLAILGLATSTVLAGHPEKGPRAEITLASHHGHHGGHHGHHGYHHGHSRPWHPGYGAVVIRPPVYRPAVVVPVPAYPPAYYYVPRSHGSLGVYGRKFGFSIDF